MKIKSLTPTKFPEANKTLLKPRGMTDEECGSLPVYNDGIDCISCWKMSFAQRIRALLFGKVWLSVRSGNTQPPDAVMCERRVFTTAKQKRAEP